MAENEPTTALGLLLWHYLHETGEFSPKASSRSYKEEAEDCPQTQDLQRYQESSALALLQASGKI